MLRDLHVRNLAVLAEASVSFGDGFNVLSGETGAGKSMVVDALALLAGGRADSSLIRTGADRLTVSGVFEPRSEGWRELLTDHGLDQVGEELVVRREIQQQGRNRVFIDDQPVTQKLLSSLAPFLMTLHGQREELGLMQPELQRDWLDRSGGEAARALRDEVRSALGAYQEHKAHLEQVSGDDRARLERIDLLKFQLREIDAVTPQLGEEIELRRDREQLRHAEAILSGLTETLRRLSEDDEVLDGLESARRAIESTQRWVPETQDWLVELEEARVRLQDVADSVERRLAASELDPSRLDEVESRLVALEGVFRRFGEDSAAVLAFRARAEEELKTLEVDEEGREALEEAVVEALSAYREAAERLSAARRGWGRQLASRVGSELSDLALGKARFSVELLRRTRTDSPLTFDGQAIDFGPLGFDQVVFQFAANPGESERPLSKVASGGELARVYLALQLAIRGDGAASLASMVFDEVDAGIGGKEAAAVGRKLRRLASGGQILAVTHLPQVASSAHHHFRIQKRVEGDRTFVSVTELEADGRVAEIARMLAGDQVTDLSRSHARELIGSGAEG